MSEELNWLGLRPGQRGYNDSSRWKGQPLFRSPPPPERQVVPVGKLPSPDPFHLHPMFIWFPTKMLKNLMQKFEFPCKKSGCRGAVKAVGVGNARVVIGGGTYSTGMPNCAQYYVVCSELQCSRCSKRWQASDPEYLDKLPDLVQTLFPALVRYRSMVCKFYLS